MTTLEIQRRLRALGFDPGPADGIRGRLTVAAVKAFQANSGLEVDGLAGPKTIAKLFGPIARPDAGTPAAFVEAKAQMRPWYEEALRLKGIRETPGAASNPVILDWAEDLDIAYPSDDIPWCGLFVAHCIGASLPDEPLPANPLGARNWLKFGVPAPPTLGAVLVFWRGSRDGWSGHVGFYGGEDAGTFTVLGGNQSDSVSLARIAKDRLLGARWPESVPLGARETAAGVGGAVSTNEA